MTKLYRKNEITFAILWIVAYVVLTSLAEALSESLGSPKSVTAAVHLALALVLFFTLRGFGSQSLMDPLRYDSVKNGYRVAGLKDWAKGEQTVIVPSAHLGEPVAACVLHCGR